MLKDSIMIKSSQMIQKESDNLNYDKCPKHQNLLYKICITCKNDICSECEKQFHRNHYMVTQEEIKPNIEEVTFLQSEIKKYVNDCTDIIDELEKWKKDIDEMISSFENKMKNNFILNSLDFVNNFNLLNISLNSTIKFRKIYSWIIEPNSENKNNKILSFLNEDNFISEQNKYFEFDNNYNYNQHYLAIKLLLKEINKMKANYIKKSEKILEFLFNNYNTKKILSNLNMNQEYYINTNRTYLNTLNNNIIIINPKKRKILKAKNLQQDINKISIDSNFNRSYNNISNEFNKLNRTYTPKNNLGNINALRKLVNGNVNETIYSKKKYNCKRTLTSRSIGLKINDLNSNFYNQIRHHTTQMFKPKKIYNSSSDSEISINSQIINTNDNFHNLKYISGKNKMKKIASNKKGKTYIHKKQKINIPNSKTLIDKNSYIQIENSEDNIHNSQSNIMNSSGKIIKSRSPFKYKNVDDSSTKKNNIINIPISFTNNNNANEIKTSLFNKFMNVDQSNKNETKFYSQRTNQIFLNDIYYSNSNNTINKNNSNINIIKPLKYEFFKINNQREINLGLDLGNIETKIGIIKNYNEIQLMCFSDNKYSIPTMISFNNNEIYIGPQTEELMIDNPSKTIFNILKIFGHDYDEIVNKNNKTHLLWPFKLYKDDYNKPFIKIKTRKEKKEIEQKYYFEDILILFLKNIFNLVFQKITFENINIDLSKNEKSNLKLNLTVAIPNSFNYYQRKILEKIFFTEIFPNNCVYGGYQIELENISIEGRSCLAGLCLKNNPKIKKNNILIINLDTCCFEVSIISLHDNINQVIASESIELLEENYIDNFINLCLSLLKKNNINIPKEFLFSGSLLSKIRKLSLNIIKDLTLNDDSIFIIDNLNNGNGNCVIKVNKVEYEKICFELCKKIITSIKNVLKESNLNENDINDLILIGEELNMSKLNQMIKELFINNANIYDKIPSSKNLDRNDDNKDYFIVSGAALRAYNINNQSDSYIFKNVSQFNIGIESYDGSFDMLIRQNCGLPLHINKIIKVKNNYNDNNIIINMFEGEQNSAKKNRFISQIMFNKKEFNFIKHINESEYLELYIEFEIDCFLNIKFYINDDKTYKNFIKNEISNKGNEN